LDSLCVLHVAAGEKDSTESQISTCTGNDWHR